MLPVPTESPDLLVSGGGAPHRQWQPRGPRVTLLAAAALLLLGLASFGGGWRLGRASASPQGVVLQTQRMQQQLMQLQQQLLEQQQGQQLQATGLSHDIAAQEVAARAAEAAVAGAMAEAQGQEQRPEDIEQEQQQRQQQESEEKQEQQQLHEQGGGQGEQARQQPWCSYGALRGSWVSGARAGSHWRLFSPSCQLQNLLQMYKPVKSNDSGVSSLGSGGGGSSGSDQASVPELRLLLLSDSVDRYITGHLCEWLGGQQEAQVAKEMLPAAKAAGSIPSDAGGEGEPSRRPRLRRRRFQEQPQPPVDAPPSAAPRQQEAGKGEAQEQKGGSSKVAGGGASPSSPAPTNVYTTAYSLHKCVTPVPVKIASSYFPGVHPTGPWHRNLAQSYRQRIDSAAALWRDFAGDKPPQLVVGCERGGW
jgi:hypothetical protein